MFKHFIWAVMIVVGISTTQAQLLSLRNETQDPFELMQRFDYQNQPADLYGDELAKALLLTPRMSEEQTKAFLKMVLDSAATNPSYTSTTVKIMDAFYNHPNSPYRNESRYIMVLTEIVDNPSIDETSKLSPRMRLEQVLKNSVRERAANFRYKDISDNEGELYELKADYTILFFVNPDCNECAHVKELFTSHKAITQRSGLRILAIYPDTNFEEWRNDAHPKSSQWINACDPWQSINNQELYYLPALPTLYLLDGEKRVVLKNVYAEEIIEYLSKK